MEAKLWFLKLACTVAGLFRLAGYWRRKARDAAFAAATLTDNAEERDRFCRLAVMAGKRDACRMFCFARPDFFEDRHPLPFPRHKRGVLRTLLSVALQKTARRKTARVLPFLG